MNIVSEHHYERLPRKIDDCEGPNVKIPIHKYIWNNLDANQQIKAKIKQSALQKQISAPTVLQGCPELLK